MLNKELLKIYEENLENQPNMSPDVLAKYGKLQDAIEEYIEAVSKNVFCWGYELGREEQKHDKDQSFV